MRELSITNTQYSTMLMSSIAMHGVIICNFHTDMFSRLFGFDFRDLELGYTLGLLLSILLVSMYQVMITQGHFNKELSTIEAELGNDMRKAVVEAKSHAYSILEEESIYRGIGEVNAVCLLFGILSVIYILTFTSIQV